MDRRRLGGLLAEAEENAALGEKRIVRQQAIIAEMEQQGFGSEESRKLLALLMDLQEIHIANANRLRMALESLSDQSLGPTSTGR